MQLRRGNDPAAVDDAGNGQRLGPHCGSLRRRPPLIDAGVGAVRTYRNDVPTDDGEARSQGLDGALRRCAGVLDDLKIDLGQCAVPDREAHVFAGDGGLTPAQGQPRDKDQREDCDDGAQDDFRPPRPPALGRTVASGYAGSCRCFRNAHEVQFIVLRADVDAHVRTTSPGFRPADAVRAKGDQASCFQTRRIT